VKRDLLRELVSSKKTCLIIDNSKPVDLIDMKAQVTDGRFIYMDKGLLRKDTFGEFFGLSRWTPEYASRFKKVVDEFVSSGQTNVWYENAIRTVARDCFLGIKTCSSEMWWEIDNEDDYRKAIEIVRSWHQEG
jgi:L-glutamine-phosphate cytidylyltransferase